MNIKQQNFEDIAFIEIEVIGKWKKENRQSKIENRSVEIIG